MVSRRASPPTVARVGSVSPRGAARYDGAVTQSPPAPDARSTTLWHFAGQAYAREGVAPLCLRLQDEHGLDVDVVLACVWLAAAGRRVDEPRLDAMLQAAAPVRAHILEIRRLRRAVGSERREDPAWQATYEQLLAAELAAERVELDRIEAALSPQMTGAQGEPAARAREGLRRYARRHGARSCDALLERLIDHIFGV